MLGFWNKSFPSGPSRVRRWSSSVSKSVLGLNAWRLSLKPGFHFASDRQRSQRLPTITTITIAGIESESISAIVAIVNDRQRSQKVNGTTSAATEAIVTIVTIPAIIWKPYHSERNDRDDHSNCMCPAI